MPNSLNAGQRATDPAINSNAVASYVWAVISLAFITIMGIIAVLLLRPEQDNSTIIAVIVGVTAPIILAILALITRENHLAMNSRLDQLVAVTSELARSEGKEEGKANEQAAPTGSGALKAPARTAPKLAPVPTPIPVTIVAEKPIPVIEQGNKPKPKP